MAIYTVGSLTITSDVKSFPQANSKSVSRFQNTSGATVHVSTLYGYWQSATGIRVKGVVYSDSAGLPSQLLAATQEKTSLVAGWNALQFSQPLTILAGAFVWVGAISDTSLITDSYSTGSTTVFNPDVYSDGASTTFGANPSSVSGTYSTYLEGYSTPNNTQPRTTVAALMRILHDNSADRATLTASSTAGSLVASNMLTNAKSVVWRSIGTSATITAAFPTSEMVGCIALPFCNLTSTATIRVRGYADAEGNTLAFDTGTVLACPYSRFGSWQWGEESLGVNAFSFGGGAYASVWTTTVAVKKLVINIADTANTSDYIECSRLVAGPYWSPKYNPEYGTTASSQDTSKQYRTEAGDLLTDVGTTSRKVGLNLSVLVPEDRADLWRLIRNVGMSKPLFISVYPEHTDVELEQAHQVFGKLNTLPSISASSYNIYSAPIELEEI